MLSIWKSVKYGKGLILLNLQWLSLVLKNCSLIFGIQPGSVSTNHYQKLSLSFSPPFCKRENNTTPEWHRFSQSEVVLLSSASKFRKNLANCSTRLRASSNFVSTYKLGLNLLSLLPFRDPFRFS